MLVISILVSLCFLGFIQGEYDRYTNFHIVHVELGLNLGSHVRARIKKLLALVPGIKELHYHHRFNSGSIANSNLNTIVLSLGNASLSLKMLPEEELDRLPRESFVWKFLPAPEYGENAHCLVSNGLPLSDKTHTNVSFDIYRVHYGAVVSAYASLEALGFAFLHPLEPIIPHTLRLGTNDLSEPISGINVVESPRWPERGLHLHTQHPLELTEVLGGHDIPQFGPHGPHCRHHSQRFSNASASTYCERWEDMVPDVDTFFEWCVANRLSKVEWLLLDNFKWGKGDYGTRGERLRRLTSLAHRYSLLAGADLPLGNVQQHAWHMVNVRHPLAEQADSIRRLVDFMFTAGFDFLTTESGLSEFTHPECSLMLDLLNIFATHVNETYGREAAVKVHCSSGQYCDDRFLDRSSGEPINFNLLPSLARPSLAVLVHTVQVYGLRDPTHNTYGQKNFSFLLDFLIDEVRRGERHVIFYGETSYWVNVDIDVPLFLPIYAERRLRDLQIIAKEELREKKHMSGQMIFDSGWENGYYINTVVTARGAWDVVTNRRGYYFHSDEANGGVEDFSNPGTYSGNAAEQHQNTCVTGSKDDICLLNTGEEDDTLSLEAFSVSLSPLVRIFGPAVGKEVRSILLSLAKVQADLMVKGLCGFSVRKYWVPLGTATPDLELFRSPFADPTSISGDDCPVHHKLSGLPYLCGTDTWVELPRTFSLPITQPDKVHLGERDDNLWAQVILLLDMMYMTFSKHNHQMQGLLAAVRAQKNSEYKVEKVTLGSAFELTDQALRFLEEISDGILMLHLRAKQVYLTYQAVDLRNTASSSLTPKQLLLESRNVLGLAQQVVRNMEGRYRVPVERIAGWRENPTVYRYGYLWSVRSLYFWWRDQGIAEQLAVPPSPTSKGHSVCYLNRMDPTEVAVGWGKYTLELLRILATRYSPFSSSLPLELVNCLAAPPREYNFPQDLHTPFKM